MLRKLGLSLPLLLLFAAAAWAQTGNLEGDVKDEDGKPLKGALITIDRTDIKGHYQVKTDKKGHYFHAGIPLGTYTISLEVDGKVVDSIKGVKSRLGDSVANDFDLSVAKKRNQELQKAAETGTLTKEQERGMSAEQKAAIEKRAKEQAAAMAKNKALNDAFNAGKEAMQAKNWPIAVQSFEKAGELDANQHVVWANLADSYAGLAADKATAPADVQPALEKAIEAYNKAMALKPDDPAYHNNFALVLAKAKKFPEAEAELTKAAQLDPPSAGKYYYNLGAVLVNTGQLEPAGAAFKKAIDADPNYADAQYQYGVYLISKATTTPDGKIVPPAGTREAFEKYLELKPNGPFAEGAKGMLATMESTVSTKYENPDAKKKPAPKKK